MRIVSESIEQLAGRIGEDLQKLEDLLKAFGDKKMKVRFPRGFLRTASYFRERFWFIRDDNLQRNIGYSLMLSDVYRWMLNRTDLWEHPRNADQGVCLSDGKFGREYYQRCYVRHLRKKTKLCGTLKKDAGTWNNWRRASEKTQMVVGLSQPRAPFFWSRNGNMATTN